MTSVMATRIRVVEDRVLSRFSNRGGPLTRNQLQDRTELESHRRPAVFALHQFSRRSTQLAALGCIPQKGHYASREILGRIGQKKFRSMPHRQSLGTDCG